MEMNVGPKQVMEDGQLPSTIAGRAEEGQVFCDDGKGKSEPPARKPKRFGRKA